MSTESSAEGNISNEGQQVEHLQQLHEDTIERLMAHGFRSEAFGCIMLAGDIDRSEHTLHMVRNGLDKTDKMYAHKVAFLNASIEILKKEQLRLINKGFAAWLAYRSREK